MCHSKGSANLDSQAKIFLYHCFVYHSPKSTPYFYIRGWHLKSSRTYIFISLIDLTLGVRVANSIPHRRKPRVANNLLKYK